MAGPVATVLQLGVWIPSTDQFVYHPASPTAAIINLNDGTIFSLVDSGGGKGDGLDWGMPKPTTYTATNPRTIGGKMTRRVYDDLRTVKIKLLWTGSVYTTWVANLHNLIATCEGISPDLPGALQIQLTGSSNTYYLEVMSAYVALPYEEALWTQYLSDAVEVTFECQPFFRQPKQLLQNLCMNSGFEAPSGVAVNVFNDTFTSYNAYAIQAGGALAQDTFRYNDAVQADSPLRYYRFDEASGTTAYDAMVSGSNGTLTGGVTVGVAGALTGDTDTAYTFTAASNQYVTGAATGLPTGNNAWSVECWAKIAANPGTFFMLMQFGGTTTNTAVQLYIDSAGKVRLDFTGGSTLTSTTTFTTGAYHHLVGTWDGTNLRLYIDNVAQTPITPAAANIGSSGMNIGAQYNGSIYQYYLNGQIDEPAIYGTAISAARVTAHYNAGHNSPTSTANTMVIPAAGRVSFGNTTWAGYNLWQIRFRYLNSLTATFYLHYTDANNYLAITITGTAVAVVHVIGGSTHTQATTSFNLVNEVQYWLQISQYPSITPYISGTVLTDSAGAPGVSVGVAASVMFSATTANVGQPQIAASGAALGLGGNFSNVHSVSLFGPGGWAFSSSGTGIASGGWSSVLTAYPNTASGAPVGPVLSWYGANCIAPPTGTLNAVWICGNTTSTTTIKQTAIPIVTAGDAISVYCSAGNNGVGSSCVQSLQIFEYDSTGAFLRSGTVASTTGSQHTWVTLSGTYTTGVSCAFILVELFAVDSTTGSANGLCWFDNVSVAYGTVTMPYCDLAMPQGIGQLMVSGLQGEVPSPMIAGISVWAGSSGWVNGSTYTIYMGRRASPSNSMSLINPPGAVATASSIAFALDSTSYDGYVLTSNAVQTYNELMSGTLNGLYLKQGVYEEIFRTKVTGASTPANVTLAGGYYFNPTNASTTPVGSYPNATMTPYAANGTWYVTDLGQVGFSNKLANLFSLSLQDLSAPGVYVNASVSCSAYSSGTISANGLFLIPIDAETFVGQLANASGQTIPGSNNTVWPTIYWDGMQQNVTCVISTATAYQYDNALTPTYATVVPTGVTSIGTGNMMPLLDPTQSASGFNTTSGVNEFALVVSDQNAALSPTIVQMWYWPRYLYPK